MDDTADRVQEIFSEALHMAEGERGAFLDKACEDDEKLREQVRGLLSALDQAGDAGFFNGPTSDVRDEATIAATATEQPGATIDRYKLLELIGEGGFGAVYMADQKEPVRRRVALKIIKLGMDTKQVIARFEAERQALAMMDHPNIAKVLDAGATSAGRPYFVMELVKGVPITEYCDAENLPTKGRLDLFIGVCNAVQHAHQKGIIHRDLKPSNVLITMHDDRPVPKVIDFGIAKATNRELTDKTLFTEFRQFVGTPEYMSPEQAQMSGLDIDTRSDIYALGVLLYELLTGTTPFDARELRAAGLNELQRIIREEEPPKPSTRLSTLGDNGAGIAKNRRDDPAHLARSLRGDLDWIVMKALEKNRTRRYETANEFAADVRRHLANEPVIASPPSATYRFRKLVQRNKGVFAAAGIVAVALILGLAIATTGFISAVRSRDAEIIAKRGEQTQRWLAEEAKEEAVAQRDEADQQRLRAEQALQAEASQRQVAQTEALQARTATDFLTELLAQTDPRVALSPDITVRSILDSASDKVGRSFSGQPQAEATVRTTIGQAYTSLGEAELAEPHLRRALAIREQLPETSPAELYATLLPLTDVLFDLGHPDLAALGPRTLEVGLTVIAETRPELSATLGQLFNAIISGQRDLSDRLFTQAMEQAAAAGPGDPVWTIVADSLIMDGVTLWHFLNNPAAAEPYLRQALSIYQRELPVGHPQIAYTLSGLVSLLNDTGQFEPAELLMRESSDILRSSLPEDHWHIALTDSLLGECLLGQGRFAEAETLLLASHEKIMAARGRTVTAYDSFGRVISLYDTWGRPDEAATFRTELAGTMLTLKLLPRWRVIDDALGPENRELLGMLDQLKALAAQSRTPMVNAADLSTPLAKILGDFLPLWRSTLPPDHPLSAFIARQLNFWAASWEEWSGSEPRRLMIEESLAVFRHWQMPAETGTALVLLASHANETGEHRRAEGMAREALSLIQLSYGEDTWFAALAAREVGRSLLGQERYAEAEPLLVDSYAILLGQTAEGAWGARSTRRNIIDLYTAWDQPERSRPYMQARIEEVRRTAEAPSASANDKNICAWNLLTCQPADLRDPQTALRLAREACAETNNANPAYLDTLALAQHLTGATAAAIETQEKALSLIPADAPGRGDYEAALAKFEAALESESR